MDLVIVGAGPVGLYGLYWARARGARAVVVETLPEPGGQLAALYPEKPIYDVGGYPEILARDLVAALVRQAGADEATLRLSERAEALEGEAGRFRVVTTRAAYRCKAVILAVGIGAFQPRKLRIPGAERLEGRGLTYSVGAVSAMAGRRVLVVGGGDSALDWALALQPVAAHLTLIHMKEEFEAQEGSVAALRRSRADIRTSCELREVRGGEWVEEAVIEHTPTGTRWTLPVDHIVVAIGQVAHLGPVREWGLGVKGASIPVGPTGETARPGVFAAGDVAGYEGKMKLIATGFGEVAMAVNHAMRYVREGARAFPGHSSQRGF